MRPYLWDGTLAATLRPLMTFITSDIPWMNDPRPLADRGQESAGVASVAGVGTTWQAALISRGSANSMAREQSCMRTLAVVPLLMLSLLTPCVAESPQIIVSAAASLTDVLTDLQPKAEAFIGARVLYNFGGSGTLRHQVEQGAPVDVIFAAATEDMDTLEQESLIVPSTRRDLLSNSMVLIGSSEMTPDEESTIFVSCSKKPNSWRLEIPTRFPRDGTRSRRLPATDSSLPWRRSWCSAARSAKFSHTSRAGPRRWESCSQPMR